MAIIFLSPKQLHKIAACLLSTQKLHGDVYASQDIKLECELQGDVKMSYEVEGVPYVAVIDRQGKILRAKE